MAKTDKVAEFLKSEDGQRNAKRFIKALKEGRIVCGVKHVSSSGMSRVISVCEVAKPQGAKRFYMYQFNWFIHQLGWTYVDSYSAIRVGGCGMDMVFHLLYSVCGTLQYNGFKLPERWQVLCDDYMKV